MSTGTSTWRREAWPKAICSGRDVSHLPLHAHHAPREALGANVCAVHTAKAGTILYSNARILHGIRRRRDVTELSEERRHLLVKAVRAAEKIVNMCLNSGAVSPTIGEGGRRG